MARKAAKGKGRTSYTEMKAKDFANMIKKDMEEKIDADLNGFIRSVVNDLTSDSHKNGVSPVLTGFFASSWKADHKIIKKTDERKNFPRWAKIKTVTRWSKGSSRTVLGPGQKSFIKQRHPFDPKFTRNKTIYIGNTTKYSSYALVSPKSRIPDYLVGTSPSKSMKAKIDKFFSDKRPDIRVGGSSQVIPNTDPVERRTIYTKYS